MADTNLEISLHQNLYKYTGKSSEVQQENRRQEFLNRQKDKRHREQDEHRITLLEKDCEDVIRAHKTKRVPRRNLRYKLMMSEWLLDIPSDLEEQWLSKICPSGFRCLVVAKHQHTVCYYQNGNVAKVFKSLLPGGSKNSDYPRGSTILDCVFNKNAGTVFVLDCIMWNSLTMVDTEVQYRFQWLHSKFNEDIALQNDSNTPKFKLVEAHHANKYSIQENIMENLIVNETVVPYEGIAFYHRNSHYTSGFTPLVGWIPSFALPEKLGIQVDSQHLGKQPADYTTFEDYLRKVIESKKKGRVRKNFSKMEIDCKQDDDSFENNIEM